MKKSVLMVLGLLIFASNLAFAADEVAATAPTTPIVDTYTPPAPAETAYLQTVAVAPIEEPAPAVAALAENLEFISGEITGIDEAAKSVTVKLYGETENAANDKILTVSIDESTDITDGEKDRDLKSLTAGTEVDVEYDPKTTKATYIFVY